MSKILAKTYLLSKGRILTRNGEAIVMYVYGRKEKIEKDIQHRFIAEVKPEDIDKDYVKVIK